MGGYSVSDNWRSKKITGGISRSPNRAMLRAVGFGDKDFDKPIIGVANGHSNLNPCNAGMLNDIGLPAIKKPIVGKKIKTAKFIQKTGSCSPVFSCFFLANFENINININAIIKNKYTNSIPASAKGFGI